MRPQLVPTLGLCRATVEAQATSTPPAIRWLRPDPTKDGSRLDQWCDTVGPAVVASSPRHVGPVDAFAVVSWNMHVGGGDFDALLRDLRAGELTGGRAVTEVVFLLQEAVRADPSIVPSDRVRVRVPRRIRAAKVPNDVVRTAIRAGLSLLYVPSMRNGLGVLAEVPEDRGNAILSTLPLSDQQAIELPFAEQRRVAVAAQISLPQTGAPPLTLRFVSGHLEPFPGIFGVFTGPGTRARQMEALIRALSEDTPTVLGIDLNNWLGTREHAYRRARSAFPSLLEGARRPTFTAGMQIDHIFLRLPTAWNATAVTAPRRYGSDHHPVVAYIFRKGPLAQNRP